MHKIYLDNSATSWPKPDPVKEAILTCFTETGANPGRSGHSMAVETARLVFNARELTASFFGLDDSRQVIFTQNATHAANIALKGLLSQNSHVAVCGLSHNSIMRPLRKMEQEGLSIQVLPGLEHGQLSADYLEQELHGNTDMLIVCHASNVTGALQPVRELGNFCRERKILFMVDAAQSAGVVPIDMANDCIDLLAFTGHKSLYGPQGTGGLCLDKEVQPSSLMQGGTGSRSGQEVHPDFLPDMLEAGTPNTPGIAGLVAGIKFISEAGISNILRKNSKLTQMLIKKLSLQGFTVFGPHDPEKRSGPVSFNIPGISPSEIGHRLDREYGILTRVGLHCSPRAHQTIGTAPSGTVRLSPGYFNTEEQIETTIEALSEIASQARGNA